MGDELLDIFDAEGRRIGTKPRDLVHRDGDWHMLVFVLAARTDGESRRRLLLQLRSGADDPYLGQVDVVAGGHVTARETTADAALREFCEEVGLRLSQADLVDLGRSRLQDPSGVCRNVIQQFYLCRRPVLLEELDFARVAVEVGGFLEVEVDDLAALVDRRRKRIDAIGRMRSDAGAGRPMDVTWDNVAGYTPAILDTFRRCLAAVSTYLRRAG